MSYSELLKLRTEVRNKAIKTPQEDELLAELESLSGIIDKMDFSLAMSGKACPTCGRKL